MIKLCAVVLALEGALALWLLHRLTARAAAEDAWATDSPTLARLARLGRAHVPPQPWRVKGAA